MRRVLVVAMALVVVLWGSGAGCGSDDSSSGDPSSGCGQDPGDTEDEASGCRGCGGGGGDFGDTDCDPAPSRPCPEAQDDVACNNPACDTADPDLTAACDVYCIEVCGVMQGFCSGGNDPACVCPCDEYYDAICPDCCF